MCSHLLCYHRATTNVRVPRYQSVANELRAELASAHVGDLLPSEAELGLRFGVSRVTVRRALELLRDERLVESQQGRGWLVARTPLRQPLGQFATIEAQLEALGVRSERRVVDSRVRPATGRVREVLGEGEVLEVVRLNLTDGIPFAKVTVWVASGVARGLTVEELESSSFYELLARTHRLPRPLERATQTITATVIQGEDARLLGVGSGSVGLACERVTLDDHGFPVLLSRFLFPATRAMFEIELTSDLEEIAPTGLKLVEGS